MFQQVLKGFLVLCVMVSFGMPSQALADGKEAAQEYQRVLDSAQFGEPLEQLWSELQDEMPGDSDDEIIIFGPDVSIVLSRVIPEIDKYMQYIIDQIDEIKIVRSDKGILVQVTLTKDNVTIPINDIDNVKNGALYQVKLDKKIQFVLSMWRDNIAIFGVYGFRFYVKLPWLPDAVYPMSINLNGKSQMLTVTAQALYRQVSVVGRVDVRNKEFDGIDWKTTLWKNFPKLIKLLLIII